MRRISAPAGGCRCATARRRSTSPASGTERQVGKSSRIREEALARFRARTYALLGIVFVAMFAGGVLLTHRALAPLPAMIATIERLLRTGNLRARVRVRGPSDPLEAAAQSRARSVPTDARNCWPAG